MDVQMVSRTNGTPRKFFVVAAIVKGGGSGRCGNDRQVGLMYSAKCNIDSTMKQLRN